MSPEYSSPFGPIVRYTVVIGLPREERAVRLMSCTSQGPHAAAATAVAVVRNQNPQGAIGRVEIEVVERDFEPNADDLVDYWDVA